MITTFTRIILVAVGGAGAVQLMLSLRGYWRDDQAGWISALILAAFILAGAGYVLGGVIGRRLDSLTYRIESIIHKYSTADIIVGFFGLMMGLAVAAMISLSIRGIGIVGQYLPPLIFIIAGYIGVRIALRRREEFARALPFLADAKIIAGGLKPRHATPKIVDTSIIIDGRLLDICRTRFLEGDIVIPTFVLAELQALADSQDSIKRNKGRRGLDLLAELQRDSNVELHILDRIASPGQVDAELVKVAQELGGAIVTKDFNLQKVAELSNIPVLNINQLANSVKSFVVAGETLQITVIKLGKEANQGVGYLDDGTMVVVEGGKSHVGEDMEVAVTSVLQTPSGKIIFARPAAAA